jgi:hypothetical protein
MPAPNIGANPAANAFLVLDFSHIFSENSANLKLA